MTGHRAKPIDPTKFYAVLATMEAPIAANDGSNTALAAILVDLAELDRRLAS